MKNIDSQIIFMDIQTLKDYSLMIDYIKNNFNLHLTTPIEQLKGYIKPNNFKLLIENKNCYLCDMNTLSSPLLNTKFINSQELRDGEQDLPFNYLT